MINQEFSYRDLTCFDLSNTTGLNNTEIHGSCFSSKEPNTVVFPEGMSGVVFTGCIIENIFIPNGNSIGDNCIYRNIKKQSDGNVWVLDELLKPIEPVDKVIFMEEGRNIDPAKL